MNTEKLVTHLNRIDHDRLFKVVVHAKEYIYMHRKTVENITMNWTQI
jgi:hypothetical protein